MMMIRNPTPERESSSAPTPSVFPDWIKAVRELGSFALIIYLFISGFSQLRETSDRLADTVNALENSQIEQRDAIRELTHAVDKLVVKTK